MFPHGGQAPDPAVKLAVGDRVEPGLVDPARASRAVLDDLVPSLAQCRTFGVAVEHGLDDLPVGQTRAAGGGGDLRVGSQRPQLVVRLDQLGEAIGRPSHICH